MCLTIPSKVIGIERDFAVVQDSNGIKKVKLFFVSDVNVGDWVLHIADFAVKKIPEQDALEILELLQTPSAVNVSELSAGFQEIIKLSKIRDLEKQEIIYLLNTDGAEKQALFSEANIVRKTYLKDFICIHGIIEFSNFCKNDCAYCGLRCENLELRRYRMDVDEIVEAADQAANRDGYKLLVLQSGEDYFYTDDMLCQIVQRIKEKCRVFIFMSIGERGYECYKKLKQAGVSGALFRFETANPDLFKKLHPRGKKLASRFEHLRFMKELGYFIATGSLIGLPGQTVQDLADDILTMKKWANMISMGPFIPCDNTPLAGFIHGDPEMNLKMISILRLLKKEARIPAVTALETLLGEQARKRSLQSGANSLMINLTPAKYRPFYKIYPNRFYQEKSIWETYGLFKYEESYKMLEERMQEELNAI